MDVESDHYNNKNSSSSVVTYPQMVMTDEAWFT